MISQVSRCAWTTRRGFRGLEGVGSEREVRSRPRATYRTRSPAAATEVLKGSCTPNIPRASTSHGPSIRVGRPCRPGTRLNPAMEHTDSIEQGGNYREQGRLISLLRDLTESDRALLEWRIVDGWDCAAIARRLGIPRADLVKRVHRIQTDVRLKARALGAGEVKLDIAATMTV